MCLIFLNIAHTACNHNRLMKTVSLCAEIIFQRAKITAQIRTTKLIVKRRTANRSVNHNLQSTCHTIGLAIGRFFPFASCIRQIQVGDRKARQTCFGTRTPSRCPFITNFTARTRCRTCKWSNGSWVIVRFHFH